MIIRFTLILLFATTLLFANSKIKIYNGRDALKISKIDNNVLFTGLKNKGLYKLNKNNTKIQVLPKNITIVNISKNNGLLNIETNYAHYIYNGKKLNQVKNNSLKVKQMKKNIYIKKNNSWLKINPNNNDTYYAPKIKNNLVLFSGLKTGLLLYNIDTQITTYISKGVDASFSDNGKKITFAKVYDDGANYTSSEIFVYDIKSKKITKIIKKEGKIINRYPYLYNSTLYFNKDFNIYKLNLDKE